MFLQLSVTGKACSVQQGPGRPTSPHSAAPRKEPLEQDGDFSRGSALGQRGSEQDKSRAHDQTTLEIFPGNEPYTRIAAESYSRETASKVSLYELLGGVVLMYPKGYHTPCVVKDDLALPCSTHPGGPLHSALYLQHLK